MATLYLDAVDFSCIPAKRFAVPVVDVDPQGYEGGLIWNSTEQVLKHYDGTDWAVVGSGGAGGPQYALLSDVDDRFAKVALWVGDPTPLHVNSTLSEWLSDLADEVHHLSARPAFSLDGILHVDLYNGFARVFSNTPELEIGGEKWVEFELATTPAPGGTVPPGSNSVASSAGTLVRAGGTQGPVVGETGGAVSQMALANYISQNRICRVLYDLSNPVRPTLTILETLDAIPTGTSALHLGALYDVSAPANTPAGKVLGTVAEGSWGPVDPPAGGGGVSPSDSNPSTVTLSGVQSPGTSPLYARADHRHVAYTSTPVALGPAAAMGSSTNFSRADHVHPVPAIGSLADVTAPADTPAGKVLGTTATGAWGPVDPPAAVDAIPAVDIPVVTFGTLSSSAAPTITSSGWHREKRVGSSEVVEATPINRSADLDIAGTTFFRYISLPNAQGTTANPGHYISSPYLPGSSSSVQNQRWKMGIEFTTTSMYVQFRLRAPSASPSFGLLYVNGRPVQDTFITATGISAGAGYYALLTFPDSRERTIRLLNVNGQEGQFGGVAVDTGATCKAPLSPVGIRVAVIGDSYSVSSGGVSLVRNWVLDVAKHLGADEVVNAGIGGTGWVVQLSTGAASCFDARYSLVSAFAPDIVLFCGGRNDAPGIQSAVEAGVRAFPNSVVAVISTASNSTQATVTSQIEAACAATGAIPVMLNVDGYEKGGDAIHLTEAGHRLFARDIAESLDKGMSRSATFDRVNLRTPPILVLGKTDPVPGGTAAGTLIVRRDV